MAAIYCADVWCDDCADQIREDIQASGHAPTDPDDERSYDSDEYPKHTSDNEESDWPQHCAAHAECINAIELSDGSKVGYLFGSLTVDGVCYVIEAISEGGLVAELWKDHFTSEGYVLD